MDYDKKHKRQLVRIIIAEVGMVLSVVAIVVVATMAAMGFMISGNGGIEQSGLMQLHTLPTGASVKIDGGTIFPRTNLSRTLTAGSHNLEIYRDGYDSWKKDINVYSGVLLRIFYPRLFLQNRVAEVTKTLADDKGLEFYAPSKNRNYILYAVEDSAEWQLIDARSDEIKVTPLDMSGVLPGVIEQDNPASKLEKNAAKTYTYKFEGKINEVRWSSSEEKVLVSVTYDGKTEWVLVNLRDIASSLNITRTFGLGETQLEIIDSAANQLYALEKQQLRRINTVDGVISRVLVDCVVEFSSRGSSVMYIANASEDKRIIGMYRDDEKGGTVLTEIPQGKTAKIALSRYYDEDYMYYALDNKVTVVYGKIPNYEENGASLSELKELVVQKELSNLPKSVTVSPDGEYVVAQSGAKMMVLDLDMGDLYEYEAPSAQLRWFDAGMMYAVNGEELLVWDFDGTNRRDLSASAERLAGTKLINNAVMVTSNNRWLYYLVSDDSKIELVREKIRD